MKTKPKAPAKANLTDPGSRLMPTRRGWVQGYNVQIAVTDDQLIVATGVGQDTGDSRQFVPMIAAAEQAAADCRQAIGRTDITIGTTLADAGYASEDNLTAPGTEVSGEVSWTTANSASDRSWATTPCTATAWSC